MAGEIVGAKVAAARANLAMSRRELSERTQAFGHISESTIKRIEALGDKPGQAYPRTVKSLSEALGVDVADLR